MTAEQLYARLKNIKVGGSFCQFSLKKCQELVPLINEINRLKAEKNAVILVHTYVSPEIVYGVGDYIGDSYGLSKNAMETDAKTIVFVAVRFMGETAKILNPEKEVLIPSDYNGCDLADCIDAAKVRELRKQFPNHTFVCYINTSCEVKAECDVCVTSANVVKIIERIPNNNIYFLPDNLMGQNLIESMKKLGVKKNIEIFSGSCCVHRDYHVDDVLRIRTEYPDAKIVSHPECRPEVCKESDFVGSTSQMFKYIRESLSEQFMMITECGLSSRLNVEFPDKKIVGSCTLCPFMKSNTLADILRVLKNPTDKDRVIIDPELLKRAKKSLDKMFEYGK
ncbi:MAG: quinolinate synthase NadA [Candidatus Omnitrophica bacterium]|nr:quinolinate synthase NadA [Candidatus Omnitrophota bacterium]